MISPETQLRIAEIRVKAREGTLTLDETKEAIRFLRAERLNMVPTKAASRTKKTVETPDADDLLKDLGL